MSLTNDSRHGWSPRTLCSHDMISWLSRVLQCGGENRALFETLLDYKDLPAMLLSISPHFNPEIWNGQNWTLKESKHWLSLYNQPWLNALAPLAPVAVEIALEPAHAKTASIDQTQWKLNYNDFVMDDHNDGFWLLFLYFGEQFVWSCSSILWHVDLIHKLAMYCRVVNLIYCWFEMLSLSIEMIEDLSCFV